MAGPPEMKPRAAFDYFLSKENAGTFKAQQMGAMKERVERIKASKRRNLRPKTEG
jgi:hypothetical protein